MRRPPRCVYCESIRARAGRYPWRLAVRDLASTVPRCEWHWRFLCAECRKGRHFHAVSFCPREERFFCIECAPAHRAVRRRFWAWSHYYRLRCPWHGEWHAALDRLEFEGRHPWQLRPAWARRRIGADPAKTVQPPWVTRIRPADRLTDEAIRRGWDRAAEWWVGRYGPRGDVNREWIIDPVLLSFLGEVRGLRILDAGCGGGYLSRILARLGADVDGVDVSPRFLAKAMAEEAREPLGVRYHRGDLAALSAFDDATFDAAVSNIVLQDVRQYGEAFREIHRVLKPGGRFVFSMTHPAFEAPVPGMWLREPEDSNRIEDRRFLKVDRYFDRVAVAWAPRGRPLVPGFHRPLRDYFEALHDAGFLVSRLEEPTPTKEALEAHYWVFADLL